MGFQGWRVGVRVSKAAIRICLNVCLTGRFASLILSLRCRTRSSANHSKSSRIKRPFEAFPASCASFLKSFWRYSLKPSAPWWFTWEAGPPQASLRGCERANCTALQLQKLRPRGWCPGNCYLPKNPPPPPKKKKKKKKKNIYIYIYKQLKT